jgi:hypothetical protein
MVGSSPDAFALFAKVMWPDAMFDGRCTCTHVGQVTSYDQVCQACRSDQNKVWRRYHRKAKRRKS